MDKCIMCGYVDPVTIKNKPLQHAMAEYVTADGKDDGVYNSILEKFTIPKNEKTGKAAYEVFRKDTWKPKVAAPVVPEKPVVPAEVKK